MPSVGQALAIAFPVLWSFVITVVCATVFLGVRWALLDRSAQSVV